MLLCLTDHNEKSKWIKLFSCLREREREKQKEKGIKFTGIIRNTALECSVFFGHFGYMSKKGYSKYTRDFLPYTFFYLKCRRD